MCQKNWFELNKTHAEIAVMNETKLCDQSTNVDEKNEEMTLPLPLTGNSPASSASSKYFEKKKSEKKGILPLFWIVIEEVGFEQVKLKSL